MPILTVSACAVSLKVNRIVETSKIAKQIEKIFRNIFNLLSLSIRPSIKGVAFEKDTVSEK
jgi:hypothetical protein